MATITYSLAFNAETNVFKVTLAKTGGAPNDANKVTDLTVTLTLYKGTTDSSRTNPVILNTSELLTTDNFTSLNSVIATTMAFDIPSEKIAELFKLDSQLNYIIFVFSSSNSADYGSINPFNNSVFLTRYLSIDNVLSKSATEAKVTIRANPAISSPTRVYLMNPDTGDETYYELTSNDLAVMNSSDPNNIGKLYEVVVPGITQGVSYYAYMTSGKDSMQKTKKIAPLALPSKPQASVYSVTSTAAKIKIKYPTSEEMGYDIPANMKISYKILKLGSSPVMIEQYLPAEDDNGEFTISTDGTYADKAANATPSELFAGEQLVENYAYFVAFTFENSIGQGLNGLPVRFIPSNRPAGVTTAVTPTTNGNTITVAAVDSDSSTMNNYRFEMKLMQGTNVIETKQVDAKTNGNKYTWDNENAKFLNVPYGTYKVFIQAFNDFGPSPIKESTVIEVRGSTAPVKDLTVTKTYTTYLNSIKLSWKKGANINNTKVNSFAVFAKTIDTNNDLTNHCLGNIVTDDQEPENTSFSFDVTTTMLTTFVANKDKTLTFYVAAIHSNTQVVQDFNTSGTNASPRGLTIETSLNNSPPTAWISYKYSEAVVNIQTDLTAPTTPTFSQVINTDSSGTIVVLADWIGTAVVSPTLPPIVYSITTSSGSYTYASNLLASNYKFINQLVIGSNNVNIVAGYQGQGVLGQSGTLVGITTVVDTTASALVFPSPSQASLRRVGQTITGANSIMLNKEEIPSGYTLNSLTLKIFNKDGEDVTTGPFDITGKNTNMPIAVTLLSTLSVLGEYTCKVIATFTDGTTNYYRESLSSLPVILDTTLAIATSPTMTLTNNKLSFAVTRGFYPGIIQVEFINIRGEISAKQMDSFTSGIAASSTKEFIGVDVKAAIIRLTTSTQSFVEVKLTA